MMVGAKYANRKNGQVVVIKDINEKFETVIVDFPNGSNRKYSLPSFNKSFKALEDENNKQEEKKATTTTEKAEKPAKETSKQSEKTEKKDKQEKAEKPKKERNAVALAYTERARKVAESLGYVTNTYKGMPTDLVVREDKKRLFEIYFSNKNIKVYTSSEKVPDDMKYNKVKSSFDASVPVEYPVNDKDFEKLVKSILEWGSEE